MHCRKDTVKGRHAVRVVAGSRGPRAQQCLCFPRCNTESEWYQIHENIIKKLNARYNLTSSNAGECGAGWRSRDSTRAPVHGTAKEGNGLLFVFLAILPACKIVRLYALPGYDR